MEIDSSLNNIRPYLLKITEYCLYILIVIYINLSYEIYKREKKIEKLKKETINMFLDLEIIKNNIEIITLSQKKCVSKSDSDKLEQYIKNHLESIKEKLE
jgi:hypothetical protein